MDEQKKHGYANREQCKVFLQRIYKVKRCCCRCEFFEPYEEVTSTYSEAGFLYFGKPVFELDYSGSCHRFPPTKEEDSLYPVYPHVTEHDWCGEFVELEKKLEIDDVCAEYLDEEDSE